MACLPRYSKKVKAMLSASIIREQAAKMGSHASKIAPAATQLFLQMPDTTYWRDRPRSTTARALRLHYPTFTIGTVSTADFPAFRLNDHLDPQNRRLLVLYDPATARTTEIIRG